MYYEFTGETLRRPESFRIKIDAVCRSEPPCPATVVPVLLPLGYSGSPGVSRRF
jgi:hypothetical protein